MLMLIFLNTIIGYFNLIRCLQRSLKDIVDLIRYIYSETASITCTWESNQSCPSVRVFAYTCVRPLLCELFSQFKSSLDET